MNYRRFRGYNRRVLTSTPFGGRSPFAVQSIAFGSTGPAGWMDVQLVGPATIVPTVDVGELSRWPFVRAVGPENIGTLIPIALESRPPTATGAVFRLVFAELLGPETNAWKQLMPVSSPAVRAVTGSPLSGWADPQVPAGPGPEVPWSVVLSYLGNPNDACWRVASVVPGSGPNNIAVNTGDPSNSPFAGLGPAGWSVSGGASVTAVADLGGGILELTLDVPSMSGMFVAFLGGGAGVNAAGFPGVTSFALL